MILKFETNTGYAYHEALELRTEDKTYNIDDIHGAYVYVDGEAKLLYYKNEKDQWQGVLYCVGYLLNNDGNTINML